MASSSGPATIPELISSAAARGPHRAAILAPGREPLTFAGLLDLVSATSRLVREAGIARADRVAMVLPNGAELAVSFLGVSAAAVAAPLNPAYRESEAAFYLDDLKPRAVVLLRGDDSPARSAAAARSIPILELDPLGSEPAGAYTLTGPSAPRHRVPDDAAPGDLALVLHTSGTTARPKLVPLTHAVLCESAANIARTFELGPSDRCLNVMPLFHVHGLVGALASSLAAGASVACAPGFISTRFFDWMSECRPTWYTAVPAMHQSILARVPSHRNVVASHSLRFIRSSSSALTPALMTSLEATFGVPALEAYGMTEAAHQIAANPLPPGARKPGSVGIATGPEVAVVDEAGAFLARNQTGEIVLRGTTVITGYLASPAVNEGAFIDGWFRTGDSGYVDADGYVFITGRIKEIINRGGEKISPREVEDVILEHPSVAAAVVFAVPNTQSGEEVGAAVVPMTGLSIDEHALRRFVASRIADFKVPRTIRFVNELPLGPTGKVQRIGMAERLGVAAEGERQAAAGAGVGPRSPLERELAAVWRDVLASQDAGIHQDFFLAGGDSILATMFVVQASETLGAYVSLVDFMEAPTIAGLAAAIERRGMRTPGRDGMARLVAIQPDGDAAPLFCTPPLDGSLVGFAMLSEHVGRDQPMWGFGQLPSRPDYSPYTVEEIASAYVEAMRALWPEGPYLLLGDCFGGFVAYEMACQLRRQGTDVALLAMVDTPFRRGWRRRSGGAAALASRLEHGLARARFQAKTLRRLGASERRQYARERVVALARSVRERLLRLVHHTCVRRGIAPPPAARDIRFDNAWAEEHYEPGTFAGRVMFFKTTAPSAGFYPSPVLGWEDLFAGEIRAIELPGEHRSRFLPETLGALAREIREEAQRRAATGANLTVNRP